MKIIVFDTEATDLVPGQICQLSYLLIEGESVIGRNIFFAVDEMSEGAYEVHGMSIEDLDELSGGDRFEDWADAVFEEFASADLLIGHNVAADDRYIRVEFERCGLQLPKIKTFCTMNYFTGVMNMKRRINIGRPKPPKLCELVEFYGLTEEFVSQKSEEWFGGGAAAHDARYDTAATWLCVVEATKKGDLKGIIDKQTEDKQMENNNELNNEMEIIELEAEDGTVVEAQLVDTFFYNGEEYAVLSELVDGKPDADEDDNLVIFFMHIIPGADDSEMDEYESIDDEKLDEELFNVYNANFSEDEQE